MLEKSGGSLASDDKGAQDLTDIEGSPAPVADIWSELTPVGIDCGAGAGICGGGKYYWPRTNVCCVYLVRVQVGLGYLGWDQRQLRTLMYPIGVLGRT